MDDGCLKFYKSGLDQNQRQKIAGLVSRFFHGKGFPNFKKMDFELANYLSDAIPGVVCDEIKKQPRRK